MSDVTNGTQSVQTQPPAPVEETKPARRESPDIFGLMQEEMNRLWGAWPFGGPLRRRMSNALMPRTDVFERGDLLVVKAELPGLTKDEVDVSIDEGDLVIEAEHKAESEVKEEAYYRMERSVGKVYRRIPLPEGTDPDQIDAVLKDGVLEVTLPLPRKREAATKKVAIK
jgi:HSP20 family protein